MNHEPLRSVSNLINKVQVPKDILAEASEFPDYKRNECSAKSFRPSDSVVGQLYHQAAEALSKLGNESSLCQPDPDLHLEGREKYSAQAFDARRSYNKVLSQILARYRNTPDIKYIAPQRYPSHRILQATEDQPVE